MLVCPQCKSSQLYTVDSRNREKDAFLSRRRQCEACGHRFSTVEIEREKYDELLKQAMRLKATEIVLMKCSSTVRKAILEMRMQVLRTLQDGKPND